MKDIGVVEKVIEEAPETLIKFQEFMFSIKNQYSIESLGGFSEWIRRQGMPPKWTHKMWLRKLEEYLQRRV